LNDQDTERAKAVIAEIKWRFPKEGIKIFFITGDE
jgi:hypothetical protein